MIKWLVLKLLRGYQLLLSPVLGSNCRFYPSCSSYSMIAIQRFGVIKGSWMSILRILRCQPRSPGGMDPVPEEWPGWIFAGNVQQPDDEDNDDSDNNTPNHQQGDNKHD